jgi:hypothetical protein
MRKPDSLTESSYWGPRETELEAIADRDYFVQVARLHFGKRITNVSRIN